MSHDANWAAGLVAKDARYRPAAYEFLFEAIDSTRRHLSKQRDHKVGHVTGAELSEGFRRLAIEQFGLMARTVLSQWGIQSTADIGEMVFNLIESGDLTKTDSDSRADFKDVFDFDEAFGNGIKIELEPDELSP
jgi:uncharacterized repeat protein (TIGR04138 family)